MSTSEVIVVVLVVVDDAANKFSQLTMGLFVVRRFCSSSHSPRSSGDDGMGQLARAIARYLLSGYVVWPTQSSPPPPSPC